jgi:hypothetical protein
MKLFPGVQRVIVQETRVKELKTGKITEYTRYFLSNISPQDRSFLEIISLIRSHWRVENTLHHKKDTLYVEDKHRLSRGNNGVVMAWLRNLTVGILQLADGYFGQQVSIPQRAQMFSFKPERLLHEII